MITEKLALSLKRIVSSEEYLDLVAIKVMLEVDKLLKYGYIKSKSIDDVAYQIFSNTGVFDNVESLMTQGMVRENINFILESKLFFDVERSWLDIAMQILYLVDTYVDIRHLKLLKEDYELMIYFEITDNSRKTLQELRKKNVV